MISSSRILSPIILIAVLIPLIGVPTQSKADEAILNAQKDNTLFESAAGLLSNGAGSFFFVGQNGATGGNLDRRGLIQIDIASFVPAGSTINSVQLDLNVSQALFFTANVGLHRVSQDWGEGTSNSDGGGLGGGGGIGATATAGDATWRHTFSPGSLWGSLGGDFTGTASASTAVGGSGSYTWNSTSLLVADVQNWLDNPTQDFGWLVLGDEATSGSAKRFDSRENGGGTGPQLNINFTSVPDILLGDVNLDGTVNLLDVEPFIALLSRGTFQSEADTNQDGIVNLLDVEPFILILSGGS